MSRAIHPTPPHFVAANEGIWGRARKTAFLGREGGQLNHSGGQDLAAHTSWVSQIHVSDALCKVHLTRRGTWKGK